MRYELTRFQAIRSLLKNRWPQFTLVILTLAGFLLAILSGGLGTPVGNRNFGIVFVWIAWWAALILIAVPFFGRGWCAICPIPFPGEWLQRGAVMDPPDRKPRRLNLRWPNRLRNIWLQNLTFTLVALFSAAILTTPGLTAIILAGMLFLAVGMGFVFERRTFCRYICPVSGFIGLYSQVAPVELRVKDKQVCLTCKEKPCYKGSAAGYGCPWDVFPGGLTKNNSCGLCLECLRTCPYDNIAVNIRNFSRDLSQPSKRVDEAFKSIIMLGSAIIYSGIFLGPWGSVKLAAFSVGSTAWLVYAAAFLGFIYLLLPALFLGVTWLTKIVSRVNVPIRNTFASLATALVPLGLMFWIAFSLSFVLTNASYILSTLSDPFGWGWNLFKTAGVSWQPLFTQLLLPLQILMLLGGLVWAASITRRIGRDLRLSPIPVVFFLTLTTMGMVGLLV